MIYKLNVIIKVKELVKFRLIIMKKKVYKLYGFRCG